MMDAKSSFNACNVPTQRLLNIIRFPVNFQRKFVGAGGRRDPQHRDCSLRRILYPDEGNFQS